MASGFAQRLAMRSVDSFLGNGTNTPIGKYKLGEKGHDDTKANGDFPIGELVGINDAGELIPAERNIKSDSIPLVVGVITEGSTVTIADPRYMPNGKHFKNVGDYQELYREFKLLNVRNCQVGANANTFSWNVVDIGTPVYLTHYTDGANHIGKLTTHLDTLDNGKQYQRIGTLGDPARREILVSLGEKIETKA